MTTDARRPLLVLGGGIAGLGAAEEAGRARCPVVVVEKEPTVGGMLRTDRREGFSFDRGGHRFITSLPWVQERLTALLGDRLEVRTRKSFVLLDGTTVHYPLQFDDLVRRLGVRTNLRAFGSYLAARGRARRAAGNEETLEEWLRLRFGDYLYRRVFEGYSEKLWGLHPSGISAEWAPQRISVPDLGAFLRQMVWPRRSTPRTWARRYLYPRTGIGDLVEALVHEVEEQGGVVERATVVTAVVPITGGFEVTLADAANPERSRRSLAVRGIVSTIPLPAARELFAEAHAALAPSSGPLPELHLRHRGLRFTNLAFDRPIPLDATWIYHPDRDSRFSRVQIPAARSAAMVPAGCGSIQLEEPWDGRGRDPASIDHDLDERVAEGRALLAALGADAGTLRFAFTTVEPHAYPVYSDGARDRARAAIAALEELPGLAVAGRQGRFRYSFLDRAYSEGVNATRRLLGFPALAEERDETPGDPIPVEGAALVG